MDFSLHPNVYATNPTLGGLRRMLEQTWISAHTPGDGTLYLISGFANYNGGARFYRTFKEHTEGGGRIVAVLGGSTRQSLSSRQVAEALLGCGAEVHVVNRRQLLHAKCYGKQTSAGQSLVVTSGNFTGPGMSGNVEAALLLDDAEVSRMSFDWSECLDRILGQGWQIHQPTTAHPADPAWSLLYDETRAVVQPDELLDTTLVLLLGHPDTARVQAEPGDVAGRGSQYFWLSRDSFDFFPPLTIRNARGYKGTLSALITMHYPALGLTHDGCRVTFEAENNLDFRLGTGPLRHTKLAAPGDLACVSRVGETEYQLRIAQAGLPLHATLDRYAATHTGNRGKRYGYVDNAVFEQLAGVRL